MLTGLIIFGLHISYEAFVVVPRNEAEQATFREKMRIENELRKEQEQEQKLAQCIDNAQARFRNENARLCIIEDKLPLECEDFLKSASPVLDFGTDGYKKLSIECKCDIDEMSNMLYLGDLLLKSDPEEEKCYERYSN